MKTLLTLISLMGSLIILKQDIFRGDFKERMEYHESDDFLFKDNNLMIFLNQTSPISDTIYIYQLNYQNYE